MWAVPAVLGAGRGCQHYLIGMKPDEKRQTAALAAQLPMGIATR